MNIWVITIVLTVLSLAMGLAFVRLVKGPTLPDRVVALELIASITVAIIVAYAMLTDVAAFIDVALVLALTGFMAAVGFARFIEHGGSRE
ncbi:MAG: monovalent cation/H+ antiporter complex subunit F [Aquisalimonadaceae bacterium]